MELLADRDFLLREIFHYALVVVILSYHGCWSRSWKEKGTAIGFVRAEKCKEQKLLRDVCLRLGPLIGIYSYKAKW